MANEAHNAYVAILAGGTGTRMGSTDAPKQFLMLGAAPIIVHTIQKFCAFNGFDKVVVLCPDGWINQTRDIVGRYLPEYAELVEVTAGGAVRNDTVMNAIRFIEENYEVDGSTVLVTHDAVRPFVSHRIIQENIDLARNTGACDTVVPATDTIVESSDGQMVTAIPDRRMLYQGQTPQSFNLAKLKELIEGLTPEEAGQLTDACKIFVLRNEPVALVRGDVANMKITYPQDLRVASALLGD